MTAANTMPVSMATPPPTMAVTPAYPIPTGPHLVATAGLPKADRRRGRDRRQADLGRAAGERRSGRDRRGGRFIRLLTEISKTLVTIQPLEQVLSRVVDLVFEVLDAERAFLLLRDTPTDPLTARVMRNSDGSVPSNATISRTIVNTVMRDRVAMLAKDAKYDPRLEASGSIHALNVRSFMCAPLWNRNDVIGVLYCDNPRSRKFTVDDLDIFASLSNYAAVAIEQARLSAQLLEETARRERLQRYYAPAIVSRILHAGAGEAFVAQERDVTVMFCDLVGFTSLCRQSGPQAIGDLLDEFFGRMADVVFAHDGTLDKFVGDALLAVFGAPFEQPDHAVRAVNAALAMRRELSVVNAEREGQPIRMRVAINSGRALAGDLGSPKRREFTVLGDVVNIAARIESSVAQPDQIVVSRQTRDRLGDAFRVESLGTVTLRGRDPELEVFAVLD
jgi:adenylate cyclase